jgi:hypothetical protein
MKTIPLKIKKPVLEILELSIEVTVETDYDCRYNFSGHVNLFEVHVCKKGNEKQDNRTTGQISGFIPYG